MKREAQYFALLVEATWSPPLIQGAAGEVFVETWLALSFPFALFLHLLVVSVPRHSVGDK